MNKFREMFGKITINFRKFPNSQPYLQHIEVVIPPGLPHQCQTLPCLTVVLWKYQSPVTTAVRSHWNARMF